MLAYLLNRIREPSTWAGLGVLLTAFGLSKEMSHHLITAATAIAAIIAIITRSPNEGDNGKP